RAELVGYGRDGLANGRAGPRDGRDRGNGRRERAQHERSVHVDGPHGRRRGARTRGSPDPRRHRGTNARAGGPVPPGTRAVVRRRRAACTGGVVRAVTTALAEDEVLEATLGDLIVGQVLGFRIGLWDA